MTESISFKLSDRDPVSKIKIMWTAIEEHLLMFFLFCICAYRYIHLNEHTHTHTPVSEAGESVE